MKSIPIEIEATIGAIKAVSNARFFATERGYHGAFYADLKLELQQRGLLQGGRILEMEYQKSEKHDLSQRPDIVFHIPTEVSHGVVSDNNYAVWALKHAGNITEAREDFDKLDQMCEVLRYPLAIFVNVSSLNTHLDSYTGRFPERIHAFGVSITKGLKIQYSYFHKGSVITKVFD